VLLYGVRDRKDILMKEQLDEWHEESMQVALLIYILLNLLDYYLA